MALTFFWRCEGTTLDGTHDYSAGDTTATAGSTATCNTDQVKVGTNSVDTDSAFGGYMEFTLDSDIILSEGQMGGWFYAENWGTITVLNAYDASNTDRRIQVLTTGSSGSGSLRFRVGSNSGNTTIDIASTLAHSNWYFITLGWDETNTSGKVAVYDSSLTLIDSGENTAISSGHYPSINHLDVLRAPDDGSYIKHLDNFMVSDDYSEDLTTYANYTSYTQVGGGGITEIPPRLHRLDDQFATIMAHKLNGMLQ